MHPPRALFVPFDFGRPFGSPNEPEFQRRVVVTALELLTRDAGPIIEDFPDDAPDYKDGGDGDENGWVCAVDFSQKQTADDGSTLQGVLDEIAALSPWFDMGQKNRGRTTVGVSGVSIEDAARYMAAFVDGDVDPSPRPDGMKADLPAHDTLKLCAEDLRAYYFESAIAQPGNASPQEVFDWFWDETSAGKLYLELDRALAASGDKALAFLAERMLIPRAMRDRMSADDQADYKDRLDTNSR